MGSGRPAFPWEGQDKQIHVSEERTQRVHLEAMCSSVKVSETYLSQIVTAAKNRQLRVLSVCLS